MCFQYPDHRSVSSIWVRFLELTLYISYHCFKLEVDVRLDDLNLPEVNKAWMTLLQLFDRVLQTAVSLVPLRISDSIY